MILLMKLKLLKMIKVKPCNFFHLRTFFLLSILISLCIKVSITIETIACKNPNENASRPDICPETDERVYIMMANKLKPATTYP